MELYLLRYANKKKKGKLLEKWMCLIKIKNKKKKKLIYHFVYN